MIKYIRSLKVHIGILYVVTGNSNPSAIAAYKKYGRQPGFTHLNGLPHERRLFMYTLDNDARAGCAPDHFFAFSRQIVVTNPAISVNMYEAPRISNFDKI